MKFIILLLISLVTLIFAVKNKWSLVIYILMNILIPFFDRDYLFTIFNSFFAIVFYVFISLKKSYVLQMFVWVSYFTVISILITLLEVY